MVNFGKIFSKNEAGSEIRSPLDYLYIKIIRDSLKLINSWPSKEVAEVESRYFSPVLLIFLTTITFGHSVGGIVYIFLNGSSLTLMDIGYSYINTFINMVIASRLLTLAISKKYKNVAKSFLTEIHLFYFKDNSEYAMKTHKRIHLISHTYTIILLIQTIAGDIFFNAMPIYNCYLSGCHKDNATENLTFVISVYIVYPFHTYSSTTGYILISIFNSIYSTLAAIWFCMLDLFLAIMIFHLWGHFKILLNKLNNFPRPSPKTKYEKLLGSCEKYSDTELLMVSDLLKDCINYHRFILRFTKKMSGAFGIMLFVYHCFHQVTGCLLLLECSQLTTGALIRYVPMTLILYQQLIQLSVVFELIGTTSENLRHAVFGLPWEVMDVHNRKTTLIFLMNVQKPIHVKALGLAKVGVASMAMVLKTSLSYFTILRSF